MKRLRAVREALQMSQAQLAKKAKISPAAISTIESGKHKPNTSTVMAILCVVVRTMVPRVNRRPILKEKET